MGVYEDFMARQGQSNIAPSGGGGIYEQFMAQQNVSQPQNQEKTIGDILGNVWEGVKQPAALALEAISYLDKPRGAIAGVVKASQDDSDLWEGAKKGWRENTSWKETFDQEWVKENPTLAAVAGFGADVFLDPAMIITPAKLVKGLGAGSKAVGLTDNIINPAIKAITTSRVGQNAIAVAQDLVGTNRLVEPLAQFKAGRATDQVVGQDIVDLVKPLKKEFGDQADNLTKYVEALDRQTQVQGIGKIDMSNLASDIKAGKVSKEQALNTLRDSGEEIPDFLLQTHQKQALAKGEKVPDYIFRDEILSAIPDEKLRKQIQIIGDKFTNLNKAVSDKLHSAGRLSDEQYVHFQGGSHLRRSFEQYEAPESFLKALRENGSPKEFREAYKALQEAKANSMGFGKAHKVNMKDFAPRLNLSEETLKKLGVITDPEYRIMDTLNRGSKAIREDEFLSKVSQMFGKSSDEAADLSRNLPTNRQYVPIPDTKSYGALAGQWVPKDVANQVLNALGTKPDNINKTLGKVVSWWKVGKLAAPAPIMRNFYSGLPMANVFGDVPIYSIPKQMSKVTQQFTTQGGKNAPLIRELRQTGILDNVWSKQELQNILGGKQNIVKKVAGWGMDAFGLPDQFWRAVVYSHHRDAGKTIEEAAKIANKALFDYSSAPEWVNWLSRSGVAPFAKFPYFAGKETLKALYEKPAQVTKYTKTQNQVNNEDREQIMPEYLKAKTLLPTGESTRIVNGKEQKVQGNIDLSYVLPFANDMSIGNPLFDAVMLAKTGRNGLGQDVLKRGMSSGEKAQAWAKNTANSLLPTVVSPYTIEKLVNGYQGNVDKMGRQYDLWDAVKQVGLGIKNVPVNIDELYRQKMVKLKMEQKDIATMMHSTGRDQSLSAEQKKERLAEYQRQMKKLGEESRKAQEAYKREKKRGAN